MAAPRGGGLHAVAAAAQGGVAQGSGPFGPSPGQELAARHATVYPKTSDEKAAVKEGFLRRGAISGVIKCMDGSLIAIIAPKVERNVAFMCRKGYYAENCMFVSDSGYPLDQWLLTTVPGHAPMHTAEGKYNIAHAAMHSVVERCTGLFMSRFCCLQRYGTLLYERERAANIVAACAVLHTQPSAV
ncbi:hypothetical protein HPB49_009271 [Dermacentor silvarum]|uniref:Uncharacterized protein n=1 Tax=Dermacentor silvarum TaxID=543639 RepID=A0ACB8C8M2_DERSI|nr:hypothetical protein HPB49_009271 [Dermacentor silvarum]